MEFDCYEEVVNCCPTNFTTETNNNDEREAQFTLCYDGEVDYNVQDDKESINKSEVEISCSHDDAEFVAVHTESSDNELTSNDEHDGESLDLNEFGDVDETEEMSDFIDVPESALVPNPADRFNLARAEFEEVCSLSIEY